MTLTVIACDDCGRYFATSHGNAMLAAINGSCPCGGRFVAEREVSESSPTTALPAGHVPSRVSTPDWTAAHTGRIFSWLSGRLRQRG